MLLMIFLIAMAVMVGSGLLLFGGIITKALIIGIVIFIIRRFYEEYKEKKQNE